MTETKVVPCLNCFAGLEVPADWNVYEAYCERCWPGVQRMRKAQARRHREFLQTMARWKEKMDEVLQR